MNESMTGACATSAAPPPERIEVSSPIGADRGGVGEIGVVLFLDKRRIAAEERAAALEFLHRAHGVTC